MRGRRLHRHSRITCARRDLGGRASAVADASISVRRRGKKNMSKSQLLRCCFCLKAVMNRQHAQFAHVLLDQLWIVIDRRKEEPPPPVHWTYGRRRRRPRLLVLMTRYAAALALHCGKICADVGWTLRACAGPGSEGGGHYVCGHRAG